MHTPIALRACVCFPSSVLATGCLAIRTAIHFSILAHPFGHSLEKYVNQDRFEFDIIEGAGHGDPLFETDENMNRVFTFLDKHLN